jgi:hypothetical protein
MSSAAFSSGAFDKAQEYAAVLYERDGPTADRGRFGRAFSPDTLTQLRHARLNRRLPTRSRVAAARRTSRIPHLDPAKNAPAAGYGARRTDTTHYCTHGQTPQPRIFQTEAANFQNQPRNIKRRWISSEREQFLPPPAPSQVHLALSTGDGEAALLRLGFASASPAGRCPDVAPSPRCSKVKPL